MQIENHMIEAIDVEAELDALAKRYKSAGGLGISVLNLVGGSADSPVSYTHLTLPTILLV